MGSCCFFYIFTSLFQQVMNTAKQISFFPLMAVTLVLILHAVLPHHHHSEAVCFTDSHCALPVEEPIGGCTDAEEHQHHGTREIASCTIQPDFLMPDSYGNVDILVAKKLQKQHVLLVLDETQPPVYALKENHLGFADADPMMWRFYLTACTLRGPPAPAC